MRIRSPDCFKFRIIRYNNLFFFFFLFFTTITSKYHNSPKTLMECTSYNAFRFESTPMNQSSSSTTTSSWVGMNSDDDDDDVSGRSSNGGDCDENEVQSSYNGALDTMDTLQQVLPIRRGISSFYNGKSKSFTSLVEASSVKEIAKPDNAYTRRRRNLLAKNHAWDRNRLKKRPTRSMISKKKRTLALLAVAMSSSGSTTTDDSISNFMPSASSFAPTLKPQLLSII